jgi:hypothetical protein
MPTPDVWHTAPFTIVPKYVEALQKNRLNRSFGWILSIQYCILLVKPRSPVRVKCRPVRTTDRKMHLRFKLPLLLALAQLPALVNFFGCVVIIKYYTHLL